MAFFQQFVGWSNCIFTQVDNINDVWVCVCVAVARKERKKRETKVGDALQSRTNQWVTLWKICFFCFFSRLWLGQLKTACSNHSLVAQQGIVHLKLQEGAIPDDPCEGRGDPVNTNSKWSISERTKWSEFCFSDLFRCFWSTDTLHFKDTTFFYPTQGAFFCALPAAG